MQILLHVFDLFGFSIILYYGVDSCIELMANNLIYIQSLLGLRDYVCILLRKNTQQ